MINKIVLISFAISVGMLICTPGFSQKINQHSKEEIKKEVIITSVYKETYHDLYTGREPVMFKSIKELPGDKLGLRVTFGSNMKEVTGFLISPDGNEYKESKTGSTDIVFEGSDQLENQAIFVKAMFDGGKVSPAQEIKFRCASSKFFSAQKMENRPSYISVKGSPTIPFLTNGPDDFIKMIPTAEERLFAEKQWGKYVLKDRGSYENAISLSKAIMEELWPHNGFPSDSMKGLRPFQQYDRMVSGKDFGYCANFAEIFTAACNALSIPTRRVAVGNVISRTEKENIQIGSQHLTTEVFDDKTNQWVWFDLQFYALGVFLGEEGPLNLAELHLFLDNPQRRKNLQLRIYDMDTKTEKMVPLTDGPIQTWEYFDGAGKKFKYYR